MRKSTNGLSAIVVEQGDLDVFSDSLFVFCSKTKKILKMIYWDKSGFALWCKKLDKESFRWLFNQGEGYLQFKADHLVLLLSGADVSRRHKKLSYTKVG